jgi:hypothetical protein
MQNFLDIALSIADKKGQNILRQNQSAQTEIENQFLPDKYKSDLAYQKAQTGKIPYDIENMKSEAAYRSAISQVARQEAALKQQQWDTQKKLYEMYMNPALGGGGMPGAGMTGIRLPGIGVLKSSGSQMPMGQIDPSTGQVMGRISTPQSKAQQTLYYNPEDSKVYGSLTTMMQNRLQKSAVAIPDLIETMKGLAPGLGPYLGAKGRARYFIDKGKVFYLHKDIPAIAKHDAAMDEIQTAAEKLIAINYLNTTNESLENMKSVLLPRKGDNEYTYSRRILEHIQKEMMNQRRINKILGRGVELGTYGNFDAGDPYGMQPQQGGMMDDQSLDSALDSLE